MGIMYVPKGIRTCMKHTRHIEDVKDQLERNNNEGLLRNFLKEYGFFGKRQKYESGWMRNASILF